MLQESWVDLDDFSKCFQTLVVFHKPNTYPNHFQKSHFKSTISSKVSSVALNCPVGSTHSAATPVRHPGSSAAAHIQVQYKPVQLHLYSYTCMPPRLLCCCTYSACTATPVQLHLCMPPRLLCCCTYSALRKYSAPLNFATFCHISG
ncbi:unnamed protein product, partial [Oncorhynchus mykiss]